MISVIVLNYLFTQWNFELFVKRSEQAYPHNYILDKEKGYKVVDIYTMIDLDLKLKRDMNIQLIVMKNQIGFLN
jgi:hypothetical protein